MLFPAAGMNCSGDPTVCFDLTEECIEGLCECKSAYKEEDGTRHCIPKGKFCFALKYTL